MGEQHSAPENVVCFLFVGLLIGAAITFIQSRIHFLQLPYTVLVFIAGIFLGLISVNVHDSHDLSFLPSLHMWDGISPHLIIFVFIPALLFGEAINLNVNHIRATIIQATILAAPVAAVGAVLLALYMQQDLIPYKIGWSTDISFLFASILSATDPVAVVALLNSLSGPSERLKYTVVGEALLNDAVAIILYQIFLPAVLIDGETLDGLGIFSYLIKLLFVSPIIGAVFGGVSVAAISLASHRFNEVDSIIQISVPLCCAYLSFFVGEHVLEVSGVLSCVSAGIMFSWLMPSLFRQFEALASFWHAIEWIANTVLFMLAGLVICTRTLQHIHMSDVANVIVIYFILFLIRAFTVFLAYPAMARVGKGCSFPEAVFMVFGGLRGAIAISLVLSVDQSTSQGLTILTPEESGQMFFYVGGIVTLTLLINATMSKQVLVWLGIAGADAEMDMVRRLIQHYARKRIVTSAWPLLETMPLQHSDMIANACKLIVLPDTYKSSGKVVFHADLESVNTTRVDHRKYTEVTVAADSKRQLFSSDDFEGDRAAGKSHSLSFDVERGHTEGHTDEHAVRRARSASAGTLGEDSNHDGAESHHSEEGWQSYIKEEEVESPSPKSKAVQPRSDEQLQQQDEQQQQQLSQAQAPGMSAAEVEMALGNADSKASPRRQRMIRASTVVANDTIVEQLRSCFLEMVRTHYWNCVISGRLSRSSVVTRLLLTSVDVGEESIHHQGLDDWPYLETMIQGGETMWDSFFESGWSWCAHHMFSALALLLSEHQQSVFEHRALVLLTFIDAHENAQSKFPLYLGENINADTIEQAIVIRESQMEVEAAKTELEKFDPEYISLIKSKQTLHTIQHHQEELLVELADEGVLKGEDVETLFSELQQDIGFAKSVFVQAERAFR